MLLGRSWELAKRCFHVLKKDKEMLVLPLMSMGIVLAILVGYVACFILSLPNLALVFLLLFFIPVLVLAVAFVGVFFEAAVVGCAIVRLEGGDPNVRDGLRTAAGGWWPLLQWAFIGILIGILLGILRSVMASVLRRGPFRLPGIAPTEFSPSLGENPGHPPRYSHGFGEFAESAWTLGEWWWIGEILSFLKGMSWAVATFFVIPIILREKLPGTPLLLYVLVNGQVR